MSFGRLERRAAPQPMSDINVTPLVDVMLVLVVIFILTAPLLAGAIRVQLPQAAGSAPAAATAQAVQLALDAAGQAYLDDAPLDDAALAERLRAAAGRSPDAEVQLRADSAVPYGRVAAVMGLIHEAGLQRIGFATEPEAKPTKR
jgi:biopolymer transport protein TolR